MCWNFLSFWGIKTTVFGDWSSRRVLLDGLIMIMKVKWLIVMVIIHMCVFSYRSNQQKEAVFDVPEYYYYYY